MPLAIRKCVEKTILDIPGLRGVTPMIFEEILSDNSKVYDVEVFVPGHGGTEVVPDLLLNFHAVDEKDANQKFLGLIEIADRWKNAIQTFEEVS